VRLLTHRPNRRRARDRKEAAEGTGYIELMATNSRASVRAGMQFVHAGARAAIEYNSLDVMKACHRCGCLSIGGAALFGASASWSS